MASVRSVAGPNLFLKQDSPLSDPGSTTSTPVTLMLPVFPALLSPHLGHGDESGTLYSCCGN